MMFNSKIIFIVATAIVLQGCTTTPIVDSNGKQVVDKDGNPMQRTCVGLPCLLHKEFGDYSVPIATVKINKEGVSASAGGSQQSVNGMPVMSTEDMKESNLHAQASSQPGAANSAQQSSQTTSPESTTAPQISTSASNQK